MINKGQKVQLTPVLEPVERRWNIAECICRAAATARFPSCGVDSTKMFLAKTQGRKGNAFMAYGHGYLNGISF